eukprot:UN01980
MAVTIPTTSTKYILQKSSPDIQSRTYVDKQNLVTRISPLLIIDQPLKRVI